MTTLPLCSARQDLLLPFSRPSSKQGSRTTFWSLMLLRRLKTYRLRVSSLSQSTGLKMSRVAESRVLLKTKHDGTAVTTSPSKSVNLWLKASQRTKLRTISRRSFKWACSKYRLTFNLLPLWTRSIFNHQSQERSCCFSTWTRHYCTLRPLKTFTRITTTGRTLSPASLRSSLMTAFAWRSGFS